MTLLRLLVLVVGASSVRGDAEAFHNGFYPPGLQGFPDRGRSLSGVPRRSDNSHCALLIPGPGKSSGRDHAIGVFNGIQLPHAGDGFTCITFPSVEAAFRAARDRHGLPRPSPSPDHKDMGNLGKVLLETTRILAQQYNLPKDVLVNGLPLVDTFKTVIGSVCPDFIPPSTCDPSKRYREYNGRCNNLESPTWGSMNTVFKRRLPPDYADGIDAPRVGHGGYPLPSPRVVSAHLHRDEGLHDHAITIMTVAWGQALDHDLTLTAETKDRANKDPECCKRPNSHPDCLPIHVPEEDPFYSLFRQQCISVVRSVPGVRYGCKLGPRTQINQVTSYIDANWVYGSSHNHADRIRLHRAGLMKSLPVFREFGMKDLLPLKLEEPDEGCIRPNNDVFCFDAGDNRVNEQLVLAVVHTLVMREHNRITIELSRVNPHWDDEKIYQEARHIIAAIVQHITYNEFLPMVLGKDVMNKYGLILEKHGYFDGYDPKVDPSMSANFITAAFRFGHSLLPSTVERWSPGHKYIASKRLSHMLRQPYDLYKGGWCDQYIMGLTNQVAQAMDDAVTQEVTNHLFQEPDKRWGMDLAAINMQRGREHGVPSYNAFREFCGLPRMYKFEDMLGYMSNKTVRRYIDVYRHPDDIDLWSGGVSERPLPGSMVGPTFSCLIGLTFKELRYGDRFWYENRGYASQFTLDQLEEIRKVKLSRMICDNSDEIKTMQVYAMVLPDHEINPRVPCNSGILPRMDLSRWRDPHGPHPRPQQPSAPLPPIQLDPTILPVNTKTHFKFPSNPESNVQASISKPPPVSLPPPPPPSPPQQHFPSAAPPSSSFSISGPVLSSPQTFGPVRPSSELHQTHPTPHAPSSSYGPPPPPPPPSPSYGVPEPEPEPEPEPHHGPSPPFEIHNPLAEPLHFTSQPAAPPHGHVPFDAPFEYCEGEFTPLPSSSQHYGPPPPLSGGYHRPHLRKRSENPIRQFLGLIGLKV